MIGGRLLIPVLLGVSASGSTRLLLLEVELLELLVDLLGVQVRGVDHWHWVQGCAWQDEALQLHLLLGTLSRLLGGLRHCGHRLELAWKLLCLDLVEEVAVLCLHAVHSTVCVDPERMWAEARTLLSIGSWEQRGIARELIVVQEVLREDKAWVSSGLLILVI